MAVGFFVKQSAGASGLARVFHADLYGQRKTKESWLAQHEIRDTAWQEVSPKSPLFLFAPRDETFFEEYEAQPKITDVFPVHSVGIATARDHFAIQWTQDSTSGVVEDFKTRNAEDARKHYGLGRDSRDWKVALAQKDVRESTGSVTPILYRPFDKRFTYYTGKTRGFICRPRPKVMRHMKAKLNLGLLTTRSTEIASGWEHAFVSRFMTQHHTVSQKEVNYLFPLYVWPENTAADSKSNRIPNLDPAFIRAVSGTLGLDFVHQSLGDMTATFGPEDVFHYIYAVLHSPEYRRRYADFLKSDFPRIPLTGNRELFASLAKLGQRLAALHLMDTKGVNRPAFPHTGGNQVDKLRYAPPSSEEEPGRVWINRDQCFEGVAPATWEFSIGGYRPAEKWLKDRKNRTLSYKEIKHYRRICAALAETREIMQSIDQAIESHGGWPLQE